MNIDSLVRLSASVEGMLRVKCAEGDEILIRSIGLGAIREAKVRANCETR